MKKRLIFDLDFFRMNHKAFRAILLKIAIKNGLLVSDAALSIMFPMSSNRKIENASFDIYYLFSVYILSEKSTPANRNKINKIQAIVLWKKSRDLWLILDSFVCIESFAGSESHSPVRHIADLVLVMGL